jgi:ATP-dependent exoDNAse (exonuclease V) beta subunit
VAATQIQEFCLQWGRSTLGMENVDALRAMAARFVAQCEGSESACTTVGFLTHCAGILASNADAGWASAATDAVTVCTWHGSKGCEWPIVILFELGSEREAHALGVHVLAGGKTTVENPLAGRKLHFWPNPYGKSLTKAAYLEHVVQTPLSQELATKGEKEDLRLLYVIWTRARDRLILATKPDKPTTGSSKKAKAEDEEQRPHLASGILRLLCTEVGKPLLAATAGGQLACAGLLHAAPLRACTPEERPPAPLVPGAWHAIPTTTPAYSAAYTSPSSLAGVATIGTPEQIGDRIALAGQPKMVNIGMALHGFLAADRPEYTLTDRQQMASTLLTNWQVSGALTSEAVVTASDNLRNWVTTQWPQAVWHKERPVTAKLPNGSILRGTADLVLELPDGFILLDHKSYPGTPAEVMRKVATFGGQLNAYAQTLATALGKPMLACYVHMPLNGFVLPVDLP